jgi:tetratricopeptide (TPR) repeat protein
MRKRLTNPIKIIASIILLVIINECSSTDKKFMPLTSSSSKAIQIALEAQALNVDGFTPKAVELYKQALELDPNFVAVNLWYGQNAGLSNDQRHEYFMKAEKNKNKVTAAEQHMIKSYLANEKDDVEAVTNELKEIIKLYPKDKYVLRLLAVRYYAYGQFDNALEYAKKSCQADTSFAAASYYQGYILATMGKTEEAEKWYKKSISMNPGVPMYYFNYGQLLRNVGRIDEAIEMYNKIPGADTDYSVNLFLGHCYTAKGEYVKARESYQKSFDLSVNDVQKNAQLLNIAYSYLYEEKLDEACSSIDKCIEFEKKSSEMKIQIIENNFNKSYCYYFYNDMTNADKFLKEGLALINTLKLSETDLNNYTKYGIFHKGWLLAVSGKSAEAEKCMEDFRDSMKDEAELNAMKATWDALRGIVAFSRKNWTDAEIFLESSKTPFSNYYLGLIYQNKGEKEKAKEVFIKIVNNNLIGLQMAIVKPFAKKKLIELSK